MAAHLVTGSVSSTNASMMRSTSVNSERFVWALAFGATTPYLTGAIVMAMAYLFAAAMVCQSQM